MTAYDHNISVTYNTGPMQRVRTIPASLSRVAIKKKISLRCDYRGKARYFYIVGKDGKPTSRIVTTVRGAFSLIRDFKPTV